MKKFILLFSLISILSFFTSCSAGYVSDEPTYIETARPMNPNPSYIWIEGDWRWNNRTRAYYRQNGRWDKPQSRSYNQGHWDNTPRGHKWVRGNRR